MSEGKIIEIEEKIADLKARWPAHSMPTSMWPQMEGLEEELEGARTGQVRLGASLCYWGKV